MDNSNQTPVTYMQEVLASHGIHATMEEIKEVMAHALDLVIFRFGLGRDLFHSESAELECGGPDSYTCVINVSIVGEEDTSNYVAAALRSLITYYITASKMADKKGFQEYVLKEGDRIALCDIRPGEWHPIYSLFPDLTNKTILR